MVVPGEITPADAHVAMNEALARLSSDVRQGRGSGHFDIQFGFTTLDGDPFPEADLEEPAEDEDFIAQAAYEVSAQIGGQDEPHPLGRLVVTALAPGQGTGKTITGTSPEQQTAGIVPVEHAGAHTELHVPISTLVPDRKAIRVYRFVNHLRLLGVQETGGQRHIITLGAVGQSPDFFERKVAGGDPTLPHPNFTLLTGLQHGERTALVNDSKTATQLTGTLSLYEESRSTMENPDDFMHHIIASEPMGIGTERIYIPPRPQVAPHPDTLDIPPAPAAAG